MTLFCTAFRASCRLSLGVNFSRNFYKATRNANSSWLVFPHCFLLQTVVDSGLLTHLDWSLLPSGLDCLSASFFANCPLRLPLPTAPLAFLGPRFPPLPVSAEISSPSLLFSFAPKLTKGSSAWRTTHIVSHCARVAVKWSKYHSWLY